MKLCKTKCCPQMLSQSVQIIMKYILNMTAAQSMDSDNFDPLTSLTCSTTIRQNVLVVIIS